MLLLLGCGGMPFVLVQKVEENLEVDRVVVVKVDDAGIRLLNLS
jgi:hypothetical protein